MTNINLEDLINELELISDEGNSFFNKTTGQLFHISKKEFQYAKYGIADDDSIPAWQKENLKIALMIIETDEFIKLPDLYEINEYSLMIEFCQALSSNLIKNEIYSAIKSGNGSLRNLQIIIEKNSLGKKWYKYKRKEFRNIALNWCTKYNIKFY